MKIACVALARPRRIAMKGMDMSKNDRGAADAVHKASGKITKVDKAKGAVTIAHGPVAA